MLLQSAKSLILIIACLAVCVPGDILAQGRSLELEFSSSMYGSTNGALPFWLHTNLDGKVDSSSANWINELRFQSGLYEGENFTLDAGGKLVGRISNKSTGFFNELYLHANYDGYLLSIGRFPDPIGLNNHDLSIGSMMVSRNATPIPKISLYTRKFQDVPFTDGHLQFNGMFSHGWLESDRYVSNALLHQKYAYLKVNIGKVSAIGGAIHNVTWGGTDPELGTLGKSFGNYLNVITGQKANENSNVPERDRNNVIGNSLAAYEFGLDYKAENFTVRLTRLFYLEDKVSTRYRSPWDGVWGLNIESKNENNLVQNFIYEHINTKQQDAKPNDAIGRANYYNNNTYESGWTYFDRTIGIPLFKTDPDSDINNVINNIVVGHHLGMNGKLAQNLSYTLLFTYTRNYGVNPDQLEKGEINFADQRSDQTSYFLQLTHELPNIDQLKFSLGLAADSGEFYANQIGGSIKMTWIGW